MVDPHRLKEEKRLSAFGGMLFGCGIGALMWAGIMWLALMP